MESNRKRKHSSDEPITDITENAGENIEEKEEKNVIDVFAPFFESCINRLKNQTCGEAADPQPSENSKCMSGSVDNIEPSVCATGSNGDGTNGDKSVIRLENTHVNGLHYYLLTSNQLIPSGTNYELYLVELSANSVETSSVVSNSLNSNMYNAERCAEGSNGNEGSGFGCNVHHCPQQAEQKDGSSEDY